MKDIRSRCALCQAETHAEDPWPSHTADCPDRVPTEQMVAVINARRTDHISADMRRQAEQRRAQARQDRAVLDALKRVAAGPPGPRRSKHTPHYIRARQLEQFQRAVDFLNSEE